MLTTFLKQKTAVTNSLGIFLDLSKAFDRIDHNIPFNKLDIYGIRDNIINWFY